MAVVFADRVDAGRRLAEQLADLAGEDTVVLGLPRGGVPVAAEVARALGAALDVLVVAKIGVPGHEELALAAVADDGQVAHNPGVMAAVGMTEVDVDVLARRHAAALANRAELFRGEAPAMPIEGRTAVLVDDGMATGATMRVAVDVVRGRRPEEVVVAVPVGSPEACARVGETADRVVCLAAPAHFRAVGTWYDDFSQVQDSTVREILADARSHGAGRAGR
ncbi:MAG TPA: phosphoribosyltransferase family protein [Acidimicrobiales bacterium]|nr:phosphoribosyltransferase family protein [Acidimicrobiales bacterium]